jgi:hypothetical protein
LIPNLRLDRNAPLRLFQSKRKELTMRNGIPIAYYLFRTAWSVMHLVLLAALLVAVVMWFVHDGQGVRFISAWWRISISISAAIFHVLPFPWDLW